MRRVAAALLLVASVGFAACDRREPVSSCADNLHGVWLTPSGARWMMIDNGATLEAYPLFDDSVADGAPRVLDLVRGNKLGGQIKRRFMQRDATCDARAPITVTACKADALQLVLADVIPPLSYAPCRWGPQSPSRVETWTR